MISTLQHLIAVARGDKPADLVLKNATVIDVFSREFITGDVAIAGGKIAGVGSYTGTTEVDCTGKYVTPSLIDAHAHIESTCVLPTEYAAAVLPHGVTTVIADPHEIANVAGIPGVEFMRENARDLPVDIHFMVPSCVPATKHERGGAVLDPAAVEQLMGESLGLGEVMDYPAVISGDASILEKIQSAPIADGHAPFLAGLDLNAYAAAGIATDHECSTTEEMLAKIRTGMYIQLREGSYSQNLATLISAVDSDNLSRCLLCSDDRHIGEILAEGTIDHSIRKAISLGCNPIYAIVMGTLNPSLCYGLQKRGAIAPGYKADLLIVDDLEQFSIAEVYKDGKPVSSKTSGEKPGANVNGNSQVGENGKLNSAETRKVELPAGIARSVILPTVTAETFAVELGSDEIPAIQLGSYDITTKKVFISPQDATVKVAVLERYGNGGSVGIGFVTNYGIQKGAIASTVSHDSHNMVVMGDSDSDMAFAVNALGADGGVIVVSQGEVLAHLPLPVGGLMSLHGAEEVTDLQESVDKAARSLGVNEEVDPLMAIGFISLPVIPEVRITSNGLFDVTRGEFC